jgi:hypothetical protein
MSADDTRRMVADLQGGGRRFEPCSAHSLTRIFATKRGRAADAREPNANRLHTPGQAGERSVILCFGAECFTWGG